MSTSCPDPELSFIAPAHDEGDNVESLVREIKAAADTSGATYEIIVVDDASTDDTLRRLTELAGDVPALRVVELPATERGGPNGQSAAFRAGFHHARGELFITIDADLQNDPADVPDLLAALRAEPADLVQGDRSAARRDSAAKRFGSAVGRMARRFILGDTVRDTGCSLRVMRREVALAMPLQFRGMHRFIPVLARRFGFRVIERPVTHRPRRAGRSKYTNLGRAWPGFMDCLAVRWMLRRHDRVAPGGSALSSPTTPASQADGDTADATTRKEATRS